MPTLAIAPNPGLIDEPIRITAAGFSARARVTVRLRASTLRAETSETFIADDTGLGKRSPDQPLPNRTVFSVEPGIYLEGETGVRIEDLVVIDVEANRVEMVTKFPRDEVVVGI